MKILCLLNGDTWHQRDPAGLGCSAPRAWAEGRKTPATHPQHGTPGNHRGRDVWSESWQPHLGNWINIYGHANKSQENLKDVIILPFLQNMVYLYLQWSTSGISLAGGLPSVSYNRDMSFKKEAWQHWSLVGAFHCELPSQTSRPGSLCTQHPPVLDPLWTVKSEGRALDWFWNSNTGRSWMRKSQGKILWCKEVIRHQDSTQRHADITIMGWS